MKLTEALSSGRVALIAICISIAIMPVLYQGDGSSPEALAQAGMTEISGDPNGDGSVNVGDAVYLINFVFKSGPPPVPVADLQYNRIMLEINGLAVDHELLMARLDSMDSILYVIHRLSESGALTDGWPRLIINRSDYTIDSNGNIIFNAGPSGESLNGG